MYHKRPPQATKSLAEWIEENHPGQATPMKNDEFAWHRSAYKPPIEDIKEAQAEHEERAEVPKIKQYEAIFSEENENMTKSNALVNKLKDEREELTNNILKIDDKVINPVGISDFQVNALIAQRNSMCCTARILDMRINDLEDK